MTKSADDHDANSDSLSIAKANLRDTIKWLAASLAALAATVLAGTSLSGVFGLHGDRLFWASISGFGGLICVLLALGVLLSLLTTRTFFISQLREEEGLQAIRKRIDEHALDALPAEYKTIEELLDTRNRAITAIQNSSKKLDDPTYVSASTYLRSLRPDLLQLTSRVHYEALRGNLARQMPLLLLLTLGALAGLVGFAYLTGTARDGASSGMGVVELSPGKDWATVAHALAIACGNAEKLKARIVSGASPGWLELQLIDPQACSGARISVPARLAVVLSPQ